MDSPIVIFLERQEGLPGNAKPALHLYDKDGAAKGNCTIGWGHLVHKGPCDDALSEKVFRDGIDEAEAYHLLKVDIAGDKQRPDGRYSALPWVDKCDERPLNTLELTALLALAFESPGAVCSSPTMTACPVGYMINRTNFPYEEAVGTWLSPRCGTHGVGNRRSAEVFDFTYGTRGQPSPCPCYEQQYRLCTPTGPSIKKIPSHCPRGRGDYLSARH